MGYTLKWGQCFLNIRKYGVLLWRAVRQLEQVACEVVKSPFLKVLKIQLDRVVENMLQLNLLEEVLDSFLPASPWGGGSNKLNKIQPRDHGLLVQE